jgi:hypothetical protein
VQVIVENYTGGCAWNTPNYPSNYSDNLNISKNLTVYGATTNLKVFVNG